MNEQFGELVEQEGCEDNESNQPVPFKNPICEKLAKKSRRTKSSFIVQMLEENIEDYEDAYEALERLKDKKAKYLTTEEVEKELDL